MVESRDGPSSRALGNPSGRHSFLHETTENGRTIDVEDDLRRMTLFVKGCRHQRDGPLVFVSRRAATETATRKGSSPCSGDNGGYGPRLSAHGIGTAAEIDLFRHRRGKEIRSTMIRRYG